MNKYNVSTRIMSLPTHMKWPAAKLNSRKYPISNPNLALKWVLSDHMKARHVKE